MFGYTSTSLNKDIAENFAWENEKTGQKKVIFHIKWNSLNYHYFLNAGAYDYENEVLLVDGVELIVESVYDNLDFKGKYVHTLITL